MFKGFYGDAYYSISVDENRLICENGVDYSGLIKNLEIFLALGIERKDVIFRDHHGRWIKRRHDYRNIIEHCALKIDENFDMSNIFMSDPANPFLYPYVK